MSDAPTVENPSDLYTLWAQRFNAGDVEGVLALAEPGSALVPQPGTVVTGDAYREALENLAALGVPIEFRLKHSLVSGDIALMIYDWTMAGTGTDGNAVNLAGTTADVLQRGQHGWRFVIDNPFGTA